MVCKNIIGQYGFKTTETVPVAKTSQEDQGLKLGIGAIEFRGDKSLEV